jgi:hypothetical protein
MTLPKIILFLSLSIAFAFQANGQLNQNLLQQKCANDVELSKCLVADHSWIQVPDYQNREAWNRVGAKYRSLILEKGEKLLDFTFKTTPATYYLETVRTGNRSLADGFNGEKFTALKNLMMAELVEGKGRFIDKIVDGVFSVCEMTSWSGTSHLSAQKVGIGLPDVEEPIVDLSVAEIGNMLSWCYYFFKPEFDKINPLIAKRIEFTIKKNVLKPYMSRDYSWMGLSGQKVNNWNIWINYNMLNCILLMEKDSIKKVQGVYRTLKTSDNFINSTDEDGACEEGPGYWNHAGGKMYEYLDLLSRATNGQVTIFDNQKVKNIGAYIYKACLFYPYFMNFSDAGPTQSPSPFVVYHFGDKTNDPVLKQFGQYLVKRNGWADRIWGGVYGIEKLASGLFDYDKLAGKNAEEPRMPSFWLSGTQIAGAKDNSDTGFCFAAKGGYNAAPHGHNDVGSFMLYYNKKPIFVDAGVGGYTVKTFSKDRYTIWSMQSGYHNLVTINGQDQKDGKEFVASNCQFSDSKTAVSFSVDIAKAYLPEAKVKSWTRTYTIQKGKQFNIEDTYQLDENNGNSTINLLTNLNATIDKKGVITVSGNDVSVQLQYNPQKVEATIEPVDMGTDIIKWENGLRRLRFLIKDKSLVGKNKIIVTGNNL